MAFKKSVLVIATVACVAADDSAPCPKPSSLQAECRAISYKDLPEGAKNLLKRIGCDVGSGSNYDYGSAVDLNGDGFPEYQFCCHETSHGPCGSVILGKVKNEWKALSDRDVMGFDGACNQLSILQTTHGGYHDLCLAQQVPRLLVFDGEQYRQK
jgi:hypothetical protein